MKILHISGARSWGGNEQQLVDMIPELEKLNVQNIVFGIQNTPLHEFLKRRGTLFLYGKEKKIHKGGNFRHLKEIVQSQKPDLIHLHTNDAVTLFVVSDILFKLKIPAILSKKGMGSSMSVLSRYKYNYKNLKKIICVSKAVEHELQKRVIKQKNHHKLEVVYDGVNLDRTEVVRKEYLRDLFGLKKEVSILGNIANHTKAKDLGILLSMLHYLVNSLSVKNVHLVQLGEFSPLTAELKEQIESLDLKDYVTFGGFQDNAMDFIPQFDIYVMSSEREGLPITIFEAFYKRTPVVSTAAGGIPEAITDGVNGYLAEVKDYKGLAEKVASLLENEDLQHQFKEKSEEVFHKRFLAGTTAKNVLGVYQNVLGK